ncbi:MAG TPA: efflux RND transporter periplasmic adaptor subunit [Gemmataceae bacterium]|nr:efflux RND transporter periplasmic adaptor subunit [Gemmataceae bacterium]
MDPDSLRRLIRSLGDTKPGGSAPSDAQLLERFLTWRDQAAFELLVWRHGPMVLGVCRRLLPNLADAEDAFQATFLVLVRKAASVIRREAVGGWLYRVAHRVALRARSVLARRAVREQPGVDRLAAPACDEPAWDDLRRVLDEEIDRLPSRQRTAFVLCCLEGKTSEEAARELGCPLGTVSSRLTRARDRLRVRLARRGLAPSAGVLATALVGDASAASSTTLVEATRNAAHLLAAGKRGGHALSPRVADLTRGVLRAMFLTNLRILTLVLLLAGAFAVGGLFGLRALQAAPPEERARPADEDGPSVVQVTQPRRGGLDRTTREPCNVHAFERVNIVSAVAGYLKSQPVDIGDRVKKGQLLAEIDVPLLALDEKRATIAVEQAKNRTREADTRLTTAKAERQAAKTVILQREADAESTQAAVVFRQRQLDRLKQLQKTKTVESRAVEEQEQLLLSAKSQFAAARAAIESAKADLLVQESKVAQAETAQVTTKGDLEAAQIELDKAHLLHGQARIVAPFDGVVTHRQSLPGDYIPSPDRSERQPLLRVERIDLLRVVVQVPERDVPSTEVGAPAQMTFDVLPGVRFPGRVSRVGFVADPGTHTMRVEIDLSNPKMALRPGMSGTATLFLKKGSPRALRLPLSSLVAVGEVGFAVYIVRDGKARRTPVEVGFRDGKEAEILSGLDPRDRVVTNPRELKGDVVPVKVKE